MNNLALAYLKTLDYHHEIFRAIIQSLSPQQRKIVAFLAEKQGAIQVKTISQQLFLTHQTTSNQLKQLLEKNIVGKHTFGRESYYEIADIHFRHWLDLKARRINRLIHWCNFLDSFYQKSPQSTSTTNTRISASSSALDPELDQLLEYCFVAQSIFGS